MIVTERNMSGNNQVKQQPSNKFSMNDLRRFSWNSRRSPIVSVSSLTLPIRLMPSLAPAMTLCAMLALIGGAVDRSATWKMSLWPRPAIAEEDSATKMLHELTFEQHDGHNGWYNPSGVIFKWGKLGFSRDSVEDARIRGAGGINLPEISTDTAYNGMRSLLATARHDRGNGRVGLELVGNEAEGTPRELEYEEDYWIGFAMRNDIPTFDTDWELYHQFHNNSEAQEGYGTTNNPLISLLRKDDDSYQVMIRANLPGGERIQKLVGDFPVHLGTWDRFVWHVRLSNPEAGQPTGIVELYQGTGDGLMKKVVSEHGLRVGYRYRVPVQSASAVWMVYHGPYEPNRTVYFDDIRVYQSPDHALSIVDPKSYRETETQ